MTDPRPPTPAPARLAPLAPLFLGVIAMTAGQGMLTTLVSLRLDRSEAPSAAVGLVLSAYFLGFGAGAWRAPHFVARFGHVRSFAALAAICASAAILQGVVPSWTTWIALRAAGGFAAAGLLVVAESWLNASAPNESRGAVLSAYMMLYYLALGGGQFVLSAVGPFNTGVFSLAALAFSIAVVPVSLTRVDAPRVETPCFLSPRELTHRCPLAVAGAVGSGVVLGAFYALGPVHARSIGLSAEQAASWMGVGIFGGLLLQWPCGRLSDAVGRRPVLGLAGAGLVPIAIVSAVFGTDGGAGSYALVCAFGALAALLYPISLAHANDHFSETERTSAGASLVLLSAAGSVAGPLLGTLAGHAAGSAGLFLVCGAVGVAFALFAGARMLARRGLARGDREDFVMVPRTTTGVLDLDPRSPEREQTWSDVRAGRAARRG